MNCKNEIYCIGYIWNCNQYNKFHFLFILFQSNFPILNQFTYMALSDSVAELPYKE